MCGEGGIRDHHGTGSPVGGYGANGLLDGVVANWSGRAFSLDHRPLARLLDHEIGTEVAFTTGMAHPVTAPPKERLEEQLELYAGHDVDILDRRAENPAAADNPATT